MIYKSVILLGSALILGSGCTAAFLNTAAHGIFVQEDAKFSERNYAAADYLVQQAKSYVSKYALIKAEPLSDITQPNMESQFGKMVPEQIGIRLSQLGYRINLENVATADDINYLNPGKAADKKPDFILSGTFHRRDTEVDINARIVDTRNSQIVAVFDYTLPHNREIADLARPKPKIIRMDQ